MEAEKIQVLLEYGGSRRPLLVSKSGSMCNVIERELEKLGCIEPSVHVSAGMVAMNAPGGLFLLQRWSTTWNSFVDVESVDDIETQDRLTVVRAPSQEVKLNISLSWIDRFHFYSEGAERWATQNSPEHYLKGSHSL